MPKNNVRQPLPTVQFSALITTTRDHVRIEFGQPISVMVMEPEDAHGLAMRLLSAAKNVAAARVLTPGKREKVN